MARGRERGRGRGRTTTKTTSSIWKLSREGRNSTMAQLSQSGQPSRTAEIDESPKIIRSLGKLDLTSPHLRGKKVGTRSPPRK